MQIAIANRLLFCKCFIVWLLLITCVNYCASLHFNGVTVNKRPFAEKVRDAKTGKWIISGFFVDLLEEIRAVRANFDYDLNFVAENETVNEEFEIMNLLISELNSGRADFAIFPLTLTDIHKKLIDFTVPIIDVSTVALIHKSHACDINTLYDLVHQSDIKYGSVESSITYYELNSVDPIDNLIKNNAIRHIKQSDGVLVDNFEKGLQKVRKSNYALITDSTSAELEANEDCELTVLYGDIDYQSRFYSIAFKNGSYWLPWFNLVINELKRTSVLHELKEKYWSNECEKDDSEHYCRKNAFQNIMNTDSHNSQVNDDNVEAKSIVNREANERPKSRIDNNYRFNNANMYSQHFVLLFTVFCIHSLFIFAHL